MRGSRVRVTQAAPFKPLNDNDFFLVDRLPQKAGYKNRKHLGSMKNQGQHKARLPLPRISRKFLARRRVADAAQRSKIGRAAGQTCDQSFSASRFAKLSLPEVRLGHSNRLARSASPGTFPRHR